jgi:hypothetical protein
MPRLRPRSHGDAICREGPVAEVEPARGMRHTTTPRALKAPPFVVTLPSAKAQLVADVTHATCRTRNWLEASAQLGEAGVAIQFLIARRETHQC